MGFSYTRPVDYEKEKRLYTVSDVQSSSKEQEMER